MYIYSGITWSASVHENWRMPSSVMWCRVSLVRTDISQECIASTLLCSMPQLLTVHIVPSLLILFSLMMGAICSSKTLILRRATWHHIPEDGILHSYHHENLSLSWIIFVLTEINQHEGFLVFTAVTMKNAIFWDVTPCGFCENLQEPQGVTSQMVTFFKSSMILKMWIKQLKSSVFIYKMLCSLCFFIIFEHEGWLPPK
jgi:hypothetical protein